MPVVIKPIGARGGPRGRAEQDKAMSDAARNKIARAMKKAAKDAAPSGARLSDQDIMNALKALNTGGQKKKSGGKVKKAKGMARGGKMKAKGMARGGKAMMKKSKGMARGGKAKR